MALKERLFPKSYQTFGTPDEVNFTSDLFDSSKLDRFVKMTIEVRDAGVTYEDIQARATAENVPFNTALEVIHKEVASQ